MSLAQLLPADAPQPPVGAGQLQPPDGKLPEQTCPPLQALVEAARHPDDDAHVTRSPVLSQ